MARAKVLIIQAQIKHYRVPFFTRLYEALRHSHISLTVAYSDPNEVEASRKDNAELPAEFGQRVRAHWFGARCVYQPLLAEAMRSDLVVVGNENKFLINPLLLGLSALRLKRIAFWGIGPNMEADRSEMSEWIRRRMLRAADWWFAYAPSSVAYLEQHGIPVEVITNVQNAVDTKDFHNLVASVSDEEVARLKASLGINGGRVGLYCGLLDQTKRLPFLIEAAHIIRKKHADFHLIIVGSGPDRESVETIAAREKWIHCLGPKFGRDKAAAFRAASIFMLPGRVGLAVLDSFAAGLPLISTQLPTHGPEFSYLSDGENGIATKHDVNEYADAVMRVLDEPALLAHLQNGARAAAGKYTIEAMVENFHAGIERCLLHHSHRLAS